MSRSMAGGESQFDVLLKRNGTQHAIIEHVALYRVLLPSYPIPYNILIINI